jgi:hypothetical protein
MGSAAVVGIAVATAMPDSSGRDVTATEDYLRGQYALVREQERDLPAVGGTVQRYVRSVLASCSGAIEHAPVPIVMPRTEPHGVALHEVELSQEVLDAVTLSATHYALQGHNGRAGVLAANLGRIRWRDRAVNDVMRLRGKDNQTLMSVPLTKILMQRIAPYESVSGRRAARLIRAGEAKAERGYRTIVLQEGAARLWRGLGFALCGPQKNERCAASKG